MKRNILFIAINFLILFNSFAQLKNITRGNLLRVNFNQPGILLSDTLGQWENSSNEFYYYSERFYDYFELQNKGYFLKKANYSSYNIYFPNMQSWIMQDKDNKSEKKFVEVSGDWDILSPFMIDETYIFETSNGNWLINGEFGNAFISKDDSLKKFEGYSPISNIGYYLTSFVGKVEDRVLAILSKDNNGYFDHRVFTIDINYSPIFDSLGIDEIKFSDMKIPFKITKLIDNLYLSQSYDSDSLKIYKYSDGMFTFVKNTLGGFYPQAYYKTNWGYRDTKLYMYKDRDFVSYTFNTADTSFINETIIIDSVNKRNFVTDKYFRYGAAIEHDSLKIYDINEEKYINFFSLAGIKEPRDIFIDSPYVYVHQTTYQITNVKKENLSKIKDFKLFAYPNPFNPGTIINYQLPFPARVELKIFDILGREVSKLVDKEQNSGTYEIHFDGSNLSNGIYICSITADKFKKYLKLMLIK